MDSELAVCGRENVFIQGLGKGVVGGSCKLACACYTSQVDMCRSDCLSRSPMLAGALLPEARVPFFQEG